MSTGAQVLSGLLAALGGGVMCLPYRVVQAGATAPAPGDSRSFTPSFCSRGFAFSRVSRNWNHPGRSFLDRSWLASACLLPPIAAVGTNRRVCVRRLLTDFGLIGCVLDAFCRGGGMCVLLLGCVCTPGCVQTACVLTAPGAGTTRSRVTFWTPGLHILFAALEALRSVRVPWLP